MAPAVLGRPSASSHRRQREHRRAQLGRVPFGHAHAREARGRRPRGSRSTGRGNVDRITLTFGADFILPAAVSLCLRPRTTFPMPDRWKQAAAAVPFAVQAPSYLPPGYAWIGKMPDDQPTYDITGGRRDQAGVQDALRARRTTRIRSWGSRRPPGWTPPAASKGLDSHPRRHRLHGGAERHQGRAGVVEGGRRALLGVEHPVPLARPGRDAQDRRVDDLHPRSDEGPRRPSRWTWTRPTLAARLCERLAG